MSDTPRLPQREVRFATTSERLVYDALREQLRPDDLLLANVRLTNRGDDLEIDLLVCLAGLGIVAVEVKGYGIAYEAVDGGRWTMPRQGRPYRIDPVEQARKAAYAARDSIYGFSRWGDRGWVRFGHALVFPATTWPEDFEARECPRWRITDRDQLPDLAARLRHVLEQLPERRPLDTQDLDIVEEWFCGRMPAPTEDPER